MIRPAALILLLISVSACWTDDAPPAPPAKPGAVTLRGDLDVDIREKAQVKLVTQDGDLDASISLTKSFGVVGGALHGKGHVEAFPEADSTLYTAHIDAPADPSGPCADQPISLALSLHRRGAGTHVGGSLTAYCGRGVWHGVPARLLRFAGDLSTH
jgi:hypothetical protein